MRARHQERGAADRAPRLDPRELPGHGPGVQGLAVQPAAAHPGRPHHRVHRAGRSLRELHPPHHDSLHAALGRGGRHPRAPALPHPPRHHCPHRHHPAHRHREEERHHDDRLRPGSRARGGQVARGGDLPSLSPPLPAHHDDDHGRAPRWPAAGPRHGHGLGATPAPRHHHRGRSHPLPSAHALHHARGVSLLRTPRPALPPRAGPGLAGRPRGGRLGGIVNIAAPFIRRPIGTSLLAVGLLLAGVVAYRHLPVAPLPQVEFPVIQVQAVLPGASPETMASAVATPLERQFGRIAGVTEMTSTSLLGASTVVLQFDLNRNIDAAARDVQAAINAARSQLPPNLPNNPSYRKVNPADAPIMILALTSDTFPVAKLYDAADSILAQKLSQVDGVGQVFVGGGAKPAVRLQVDPGQLSSLGYGLEEVRAALSNVNANSPKGELSGPTTAWTINATDQLLDAEQYRPVIVAYQKGAAIRLGDVADVSTSVEDVRTGGVADGKRAVALVLFRQPGSNMIETVDRVYALLPELRASIPPAIKLAVALDRTTSIRAAFHDVQISLGIAVVLVVLVVFVFLRSVAATIIPSVAVPLSLVGTFGGMYLFGYSLDNLSLMALTISTGFVVDDTN